MTRPPTVSTGSGSVDALPPCPACHQLALTPRPLPPPAGEYGHADLQREAVSGDVERDGKWDLFAGLPPSTRVWMSHGDKIHEAPAGFVKIATTANSEWAAVMSTAACGKKNRMYGLQVSDPGS